MESKSWPLPYTHGLDQHMLTGKPQRQSGKVGAFFRGPDGVKCLGIWRG